MVSAPCGNTGKHFRCPYHAWTFRTDGSLLSMPLKNGYDGTALHECESAEGVATVNNVALHRGFIFVKLNDAGPGFAEYFGESLSSIDNLADRSPEGRLEIAGGCLRFVHQCNWKQYVENLNDTMHPMVVHESSAGTAKRMWLGKPADEPKPMAIEQFVPFMSDYQFFEDMGVRVFDNGHGFSGANFSIHSKYSAIPAYEKAMKEAYGEARTAEILGLVRHNTVYYPNLTIKGAIQSIRVARPVAVDRTIIESWTFRLVGAPPELLQRTTMYNRLINSPFSVVGHDDLHTYRGIQEGLHAGGNPWVSLHRNFCADEIGQKDLTTIGTSEISMRNQYLPGALHDAHDVAEGDGEHRRHRAPADRLRRRGGAPARREALRGMERAVHRRRVLLGAAHAGPAGRHQPHLASLRRQAVARAAHRAPEEPARLLAAAADPQSPPAADADRRLGHAGPTATSFAASSTTPSRRATRRTGSSALAGTISACRPGACA